MRTSFSCRVSSCLISACSSRGRVRSWIGKSRRDTHSKSVAHLLERREQGTKVAEQTYNVTTGYEERADDQCWLWQQPDFDLFSKTWPSRQFHAPQTSPFLHHRCSGSLFDGWCLQIGVKICIKRVQAHSSLT